MSNALMRSQAPFGPKIYRRLDTSIMFFVLAIAMRIASAPTANASYLFIAGYAMLGRVQAIQALALSWLFTMINPGIAAEASGAAVGRYAVLLGAALSVCLRSHAFRDGIRVRPVTMGTILLGAFFVVHAWIFSPMVDVSVLKAVSWTLAMSTLIAAWSGLRVDERDVLARQVFGGLIVVMLISLPLLVHPLGYLRNGTGFQGVLNHPQAFGPTMALLGAWAASRMFGETRPSWASVALVVTCLVLVLLSEARTAGLALVLGVGLSVMIAPGLAGQPVKAVLPGLKSKRLFLVAGLALVGLVLAADKVGSAVSHYISKSGRAQATTLLAAYEGSRGALMERMWDNINERPMTGIGFGIASDAAEMVVERDPLFGLPTSAAIEKGVLPLAIWEEVGLVGLVAVCAWIFVLLRRGARGGVAPVAVGLTALLLNMGESTLFSPGGQGMLSLILIGWAFAAGQG